MDFFKCARELHFVKSWISPKDRRNPRKSAFSRENALNRQQETAPSAVSCTPRNPPEPRAAPPLCRARDCHGNSGQEPEAGAKPTPDHRCLSPYARTDLCSFITHAPCRTPFAAIATGARPGAGRWTGQVHRPHRRVTTLIGMPCLTVPDPKPRPTRTDPGPEGHVRRKSREVWGGEGCEWPASLVPSVCACTPLWNRIVGLATVRVLHSRIRSPGVDASHIERHLKGEPGCKIFPSPDAVGESKIRRSPPPGTREGVRWRMGEGLRPVSVAHEGATSHSHWVLRASRSDSLWRPRLPALLAQIRPSCPDCQRAFPPHSGAV